MDGGRESTAWAELIWVCGWLLRMRTVENGDEEAWAVLSRRWCGGEWVEGKSEEKKRMAGIGEVGKGAVRGWL